MNEDQHLQTPVSGDDDLAKALSDQGGMKFEETPMPSMDMGDSVPQPPAPVVSEPDHEEDVEVPAPSMWSGNDDKKGETEQNSEAETETSESDNSHSSNSTGDSNLDKIKEDVVNEIKPLLGKLDLPAEEKFDTMLLVIRSTDDQSLLQATFEAAKEIKDEAKRAKALLDVMREVSYFSGKK